MPNSSPISCTWWTEDPARSKIIHATAWGLLLYGLVGEQLFDSAVAREIRGFRLRRDF